MVTCSCGEARTMDKASIEFALREVTRCFGNVRGSGKRTGCATSHPRPPARRVERLVRQPSLGDHHPAVVGRAFQLLDKHWDILRAIPATRSGTAIETIEPAAGTSFTADDLVEAVRSARGRQEGETGPTSEDEFRRDEYDALIAGQPDAPGQPVRRAPDRDHRATRASMLSQ